MKVDGDIMQRLKVYGLFSFQVYKVVTGTMLSLFVPQRCEDLLTNTSAVCTLQQNLEDTESYHRLALCINGLSLCAFVITYAFEMKRENWCIEYLDIDNDRPDNSLKAIIQTEPRLDSQMDRLNRMYWVSLLSTTGIYVANLGTMVPLLYEKYHSSSTISCFVSFVLLVWLKLFNSLSVARKSLTDDKMLSAYMSEFVSYNVLDCDYLESKKALGIGPRP